MHANSYEGPGLCNDGKMHAFKSYFPIENFDMPLKFQKMTITPA